MTRKLIASAVVGMAAVFLWLAWLGRQDPTAIAASDGTSTKPADKGPVVTEPAGLADVRTDDRRILEAVDTAALQAPGLGPHGSILVRVTWEIDGTPAENVRLQFQSFVDPSPPRAGRFEVTDASGFARVSDAFPGRLIIWVFRGGSKIVTVEPGREITVDLVVPVGVDVEGVVVDADGYAVPGAGIWLGQIDGRVVATADDEGRFRLRSVAQGAKIGARSPHHAPSVLYSLWEAIARGDSPVELRITLPHLGGAVRGVVLDPMGQPVEGAGVRVGRRGGNTIKMEDGTRGTAPTPVSVFTDKDGLFLSEGLALGFAQVHVLAEGFPVWPGGVHVEEGRTNFLEVRLVPGATVTGTAFTEGGVPAEGVSISIYKRNSYEVNRRVFPWPSARTDAEGSFELRFVPPGNQHFHADAPEQSGLGSDSSTLALEPGDSKEWHAVLSTGLTITGKLVDGEGNPIEGWSVNAVPSDQSLRYKQALTDADGRFFFSSCASVPYKLEARAPQIATQYPVAWKSGVTPGGEEVTLTVTDIAPPSGFVEGLLLDSAGGPMREVRLILWHEVHNSGHGELTDTRGRFRFGPQMAGRYYLRHSDAEGKTLFTSAVFEIRNGETTDVGVLQLVLPGSLDVILRRSDDGELERVSGWLRNENGHGSSCELDGDRLRADKLLPGSYRLRVSASGLADAWVPFEVHSGKETDLAVVLHPGTNRSLEFAWTAGTTWGTLKLQIRDEAGELTVDSSYPARGFLDPYRVSWRPRLGTFTYEATTDTGLRAEGVIEVTTLERDNKPIRIELF